MYLEFVNIMLQVYNLGRFLYHRSLHVITHCLAKYEARNCSRQAERWWMLTCMDLC